MSDVDHYAVRLLVCGIGLGLAAAGVASREVSTLLFGLTPTDPLTMAAAAVVLSGIGPLATFLPALRASRADPSVALRFE